jgi:tetratricopeptide (TPR) repeat protein
MSRDIIKNNAVIWFILERSMSPSSVEEFYQNFISSSEFAQLCIDVQKHLTHNSLNRDFLRQNISTWLRQYAACLESKDKSILYSRMYTAVMRGVFQQKSNEKAIEPQSSLKKTDPEHLVIFAHLDATSRTTSPLFPDLTYNDTPNYPKIITTSEMAEAALESAKPPSVRSTINRSSSQQDIFFTDAAFDYNQMDKSTSDCSSSQQDIFFTDNSARPSPISDLNIQSVSLSSLFPELDRAIDSLPSHQSKSQTEVYKTQNDASKHSLNDIGHKSTDYDILFAKISDILGKDPQTDHTLRYRIIAFEQGFYLADCITGKVWFTAAGSNELLACVVIDPALSGKSLIANLNKLSPPRPLDTLEIRKLQEHYPTPQPLSEFSALNPLNPLTSNLASQMLDVAPDASSLYPFPNTQLSQVDSESKQATPSTSFSQLAQTSFSIADRLEKHITFSAPIDPQSPTAKQAIEIALIDQNSQQDEHIQPTFSLDMPLPLGSGYKSGSDTQWVQGVNAPSTDLTTLDKQHLIDTILSHYPYPIAHTYHSFLTEHDRRLRLHLMMLVYLQVIKYMSFPLILHFLREPLLDNSPMYQALCRLQSSRWSDWLDFISRAAYIIDAPEDTLIGDIVRSFHRLETELPIEERFLYTKRFFDANGQEHVTSIHHGLLEAINLYRDSFVQGFTPTIEQATQDLITYAPILDKILLEIKWVIKYPLRCLWHIPTEDNPMQLTLMGYSPHINAGTLDETPIALFDNAQLFLSDPRDPQWWFSLSPTMILKKASAHEFSIPGHTHAMYLLHGSTGQQLSYYSLWQTPLMSSDDISWWSEQLQLKRFPPIPQEISSAQLLSLTERWTANKIDLLQQQQIYFPDVSISRPHIERSLHDFITSHYLLFILHGMAGVGKTTMLAQLAEHYLSREFPVMWLSGIDFISLNLLELISRILGIPPAHDLPDPEGLARCLSPHLDSEKPLLIILDNIDILPTLEHLITQLDASIHDFCSTSLLNRIKFIVCLQSHKLWPLRQNNQLFPLSIDRAMSFEDLQLQLYPPVVFCELPPFHEQECKAAYRKYRNFYNENCIAPFCPRTDWDELPLSSTTRLLLRHPLFMRLILFTFYEQALPVDLEISSVFRHIVEITIEEKFSVLPVPERLQFLRAISSVLLEQNTRIINLSQLYLSSALIQRVLQDPHTDSPLVQLLQLGVINEEWQNEQSWFSFTSSILFAYFVYQEWCEQHSFDDPEKFMSLTLDLPTSFPLSEIYFFKWLDAIQGEYLTAFCSWIHKNFQQIEYFLEEFMLFSMRYEGRAWRPFISNLLAVQTDNTQQILLFLLQVVDRLWFSHDEQLAIQLLDMIQVYSSKNVSIAPALLYRCARIQELQKSPKSAYSLYLEAKDLALKQNDRRLLAQIFMRLSALARNGEQRDKSAAWLEQGIELIEHTEQPQLMARIIRQQGNIAYAQGDLSQALISYQHSLRLDELSHNLRGMSASLSNLGTVFGARGDYESALSHYHRCLHIHQQLGDRKNIATDLNNIAIILKHQSNFDSALDYFNRALKFRQQLGLRRDCISSHHHIAFIFEKQGDLHHAVSHINEALRLQKHIRDQRGIAESQLKLGLLLQLQGQIHKALVKYTKTLKLAQQLQEPLYQAEALQAIAHIHWKQGNLSTALELLRNAIDILKPCSQMHPILMSSLARTTAKLLIAEQDLTSAASFLEQAMQWASNTNTNEPLIETMIESAQLALLSNQLDTARAFLHRIESLVEENFSYRSKDLLCLQLRLAIREQDPSQIYSVLEDLMPIIPQPANDSSPSHTAWALLETAHFLRDKQQNNKATELVHIAKQTMSSNQFCTYRSLEIMLEQYK